MILLDLNQAILASLHVSLGAHASGDIDLGPFRQMVAHVLRSNNRQFRHKYGEMVLCADARHDYWRKEVFPFYKISRREARAKSNINWKGIYECMDICRAELQDHFPYKYIQVPRAEADDIIAVLARKIPGKHLILSGDRDFVQLHNENVQQYDPTQNKFVTAPTTPEEYLFVHIAKGDYGDGIPNVLSADNALAVKERQKPITKKVLETLREGIDENHPAYRGLQRNKQLIDLTNVPADIEAAILEQFNQPLNRNRRSLMKYFISHRMRGQLEHINDF